MNGIYVMAFALLFSTPAVASGAETWIVRTDLWGNPAFSTLTIEQQRGQLTGDLDGDRLSGQLVSKRIAFDTTDRDSHLSHYNGWIDADRMEGVVDAPDSNHADVLVSRHFTAWRVPDRPTGGARMLDYHPVDYSNTWNADRPHVLTIWPGDVVHTTTIDSGGVDDHGVTRALFGNPQTGPFFVAGAAPGDTLAVHLKRLRLNRDYADSLDTIVGQPSRRMPGSGRWVWWVR